MLSIIKQKLKVWLGIVELEQKQMMFRVKLNNHQSFVLDRMKELKAYTRVDADLGIRGNNTIILTGVYRNKAYVKFYDLGDGEFLKLIEQMKHMQDHCLIRNVDAPPSFHNTFNI